MKLLAFTNPQGSLDTARAVAALAAGLNHAPDPSDRRAIQPMPPGALTRQILEATTPAICVCACPAPLGTEDRIGPTRVFHPGPEGIIVEFP